MSRNLAHSSMLMTVFSVAALSVAEAAALPAELLITEDGRRTAVPSLPVQSPSGSECRGYAFPVKLQATGPAEIYAEICSSRALDATMPVQVLLHGGAYNRHYWDWPHKPDQHSYVAAAVKRGYLTVNVDRLGYGESSRPDGRVLDFDLGAEAVSQVIEQLKQGALGVPLKTFVLNGHSMGGLVAERVGASRNDIAAVIVSGIANEGGNEDGDDDDEGGVEGPGENGGGGPFYSAAEDARFKVEPWAGSYMTTRENARPKIFLAPGTFDPETAQLEESLKDTLALGELMAVRGGGKPEPKPQFVGPALYVLGQFDAIACGRTGDCSTALKQDDRHVIIPNTGHSLNVSHGAPKFFAVTFDWLKSQGIAEQR